MNKYRIVFAGTPEFAATALEGLINSRHDIVAVYTQPDRPSGRGQKLLESPVKHLALQHKHIVEQPKDFKNPDSLAKLSAYKPEILLVAAYGIILPQAVLDIPSLASLNIHASLLPRWRGAAPIQRAILAGDEQTGISIMEMAKGLDTGDVLLERKLAISPSDTGSSLHDKLAILGQKTALESLDFLDILMKQKKPQDNDKACYAHKLNKSEAGIIWSESAAQIHRQIRAFNSWPVSFCKMDDETIRVWQADWLTQKHDFKYGEICAHEWQGESCLKVACQNGFILIKKLQLPGKKALPTAEVLKSKQAMFAPGKCFE